MSLKGKTALITGSTSGIGLGIAKAMADEGANIVINGFGDQSEIDSIVKEIKSKGVEAIYHNANLTKPEEIRNMADQAKKEFGCVDILVNNAGIQHVAPIEEFPPEKWDAIIAIDLSSAFHTTQSLIGAMREKGWGRIINMCSAHGLVASPYKTAYVAAKHGILGFTKVVALEAAQDNITCNAICPGYVHTPLVDNQIADTAKARGISGKEALNNVILAAQWTKKFVEVEQIAKLALFLCSDAAQNITGADLKIDGGWTAA